MEQKPAGSRSSSNTDASPSEEAGSTDKAATNNQEDDKSVYGSEEFDGQSRASPKELDVTESEYDSRDDDYGGDNQSSVNDNQSSVNSPTTEGGSVHQATKGGDGADAAAMAGDVDDQQSISTYEDDFADEESPTLQYPEKNALPSKNPEKSYDNSTNSRSSGGYLTEGQGKDGTPSEVSATAAPAPDASVTDASITDASVSDASVTGDSPPTKLNNSNEKRENGDAASASSDENNDEQRSLDVPGTPANDNDNNNSNSNYNSSGEDEAVSESFPQAQMPSRDEDDNGHASGDRIDGGVVQPEDGGASQSAVSPTSARGLEERLQAAEAENEKLRQAIEKTAGETAVDGSSGKELEMLKSQVEAARAMIMASVDDGDDKSDRGLLELIGLAETRGYKQKKTTTQTARGGVTKRKSSAAVASASKVESTIGTDLEERVESLERDLADAVQECREQSEKVVSLQRQLDAGGSGGSGSGGDSGGGGSGREGGGGQGVVGGYGEAERVATADILALKAKATQLVERLRQEKSGRLKAEHETQKVAGKVQVLSDHIEKLMMFLKHEATQKAKAHEQQRRLQKELDLVKARSSALLRSNQGKDRVMTELREGSKILEDQLRLMDEKYMELRTKLDWTRTKADKDVRRARAQASTLRTKWALLCGDGGGGGSGQPLLDTMRVDTPAYGGHSSSSPGAGSTAGGGGGYHAGGAGLGSGRGDSRSGGSGRSGKHQRHHHQPQQDPSRRGGGGGGGGSSLKGEGSLPVEARRGGPDASNSNNRGGWIGSERGPGGLSSGGGVGVPRGVGRILGPSVSDPSIPGQQQHLRQQRHTASGGGMRPLACGSSTVGGGGGGGGGVGSKKHVAGPGHNGAGGRLGSSPKGSVSFNPAFSAGSDPGGAIVGDAGSSRGGGGRAVGGGQRPPWTEQRGKGAGVGGGGGGHPQQILYA